MGQIKLEIMGTEFIFKMKFDVIGSSLVIANRPKVFGDVSLI